ncbi:hypothetical protein GCM10022402_31200 [Salinactinospora qingdaonensis]|uniref:Uncharacterized protein n=1 Tax=Salinactinospora qingdaonensis TaxID=702744 RepID=A0ABP7FW12_9ACTN
MGRLNEKPGTPDSVTGSASGSNITVNVSTQRIDLTMPLESGTGGVPALRGGAQKDGAQPGVMIVRRW